MIEHSPIEDSDKKYLSISLLTAARYVKFLRNKFETIPPIDREVEDFRRDIRHNLFHSCLRRGVDSCVGKFRTIVKLYFCLSPEEFSSITDNIDENPEAGWQEEEGLMEYVVEFILPPPIVNDRSGFYYELDSLIKEIVTQEGYEKSREHYYHLFLMKKISLSELYSLRDKLKEEALERYRKAKADWPVEAAAIYEKYKDKWSLFLLAPKDLEISTDVSSGSDSVI